MSISWRWDRHMNYSNCISEFYIKCILHHSLHLYSLLLWRFAFERTDPSQPQLEALFTIDPPCGSLMPRDKRQTQIICKPTTEICIKEQPILLCQVWDINSQRFWYSIYVNRFYTFYTYCTVPTVKLCTLCTVFVSIAITNVIHKTIMYTCHVHI